MNTTTSQQPTPTTQAVPEELPGRAVDIVAAAAHAEGLHLTSVVLSFDDDPAPRIWEISAHLTDHHIAAAQRLIGALGAVAQVSDPYGAAGQRQVNVQAPIPALGGRIVAVIATQGLPPEPSDPTALITTIDTRRAAAAAQNGTP